MKIAYCSDLHYEFLDDSSWLPVEAGSCNVLVLAGDIAVGKAAIEVVTRIADSLPGTEVIYVAGNHEFYHTSIDEQLEMLRAGFQDHQRIHFLENDAIEINGVRFLGCTLWTGFDLFGKDLVRQIIRLAENTIADFQVIRDKRNSQLFNPVSAVQRYRDSRLWLYKQLSEGEMDKTVVVTHFPPCREARHGAIPEDLLSAYFQANCDSMIEQFQPAAWIYGHNHWSDSLKIGHTLVVSNQLGYPSEDGTIPDHDPRNILTIMN